MSATIQASVGRNRGNNASNRRQDVLTIQQLLSEAAIQLQNDSYNPGDIDGLIATPPRSSATVSAIIAFQKRWMRNADGVVEPGRKTLAMLNETSQGQSTPTKTSASSVKAVPAPHPAATGTLSLSKAFLGKGMSEICPSGYADTSNNHCAHFVGHALDIRVGLTCHGMASRKKRKGESASLRVHEIFAACPTVSEYDSSMLAKKGLMFVSGVSNFVTAKSGVTSLRNVPKKHIGILVGGKVWHYSNSRNKVVSQTPEEFIKHYRGQKNALWFGDLPKGAIRQFTV
ncbi:hypothetical protein LOC67_15235 [Stieleria sp. JC731]|uniref:peptidoglycan-binding domain-containing protein n=1 Tax=Pirellulaceae TaxID=2691357 RepID=UPI001E4AAF77|nr:hypothetical protein [Stieleria sp. JC731]MCC9601913.1 hypothetical protein [Stieleria sp. JC731]